MLSNPAKQLKKLEGMSFKFLAVGDKSITMTPMPHLLHQNMSDEELKYFL